MADPGNPNASLDYASIFHRMPIGQLVTRDRVIMDCSADFAALFLLPRVALLGQSTRILYPTTLDFEEAGQRVADILSAHGRFVDSRLMRRTNGQLFWVSVQGYSQYRADPYAEALWIFTELGTGLLPRPSVDSDSLTQQLHLRRDMTMRERDVAALLAQNLTAKEIGRALGISHRTVEIHKARLMRKFGVHDTRSLVTCLLY